MRTDELKAWLLGSHGEPISAMQIRAFLGVEPGALPSASRRSLGFVVAALRDTYVDELEVWGWFLRPHRHLGGTRPADLLLAGRVRELEALVVHQWNLRSSDSELGGIMLGVLPLAETSVPASLHSPNRNRIASTASR